MSEPHQARAIAESFGIDAERYDRTRPSYPGALVSQIVADSPGPDVLDVGTGTGISARQLQAAGCAVLGVEPDARMADFARRTGVEVEVATFEDWDSGGRTFDAVVAGQTWHWVDPAAGAVKAARVLRPGGLFAVFWNAFDPAPELKAAFAAVYERVFPDATVKPWSGPLLDPYAKMLDKTADGLRQAGSFGDPARWRFDWERVCTREQWLDELPTHGLHTRLGPDKLGELLTGMGAAVDAMGGSFTMRFAAMGLIASRKDAS
jgi:SAM-dependent methyltransferase